MKRIICLLLTFATLLFCLCSCKMRYLPVYGKAMDMPYFVIQELPTKNAGGETTLDFWIGEKVSESDYEGYTTVYDGFLGKGYAEDVLSSASVRTEKYVHYTVRNYPKVDSKTISNVRAYNRANSLMWKQYSISFWMCGVLSIASIWARWCAAAYTILIFAGSIGGGIWLVLRYQQISRKYTVKTQN